MQRQSKLHRAICDLTAVTGEENVLDDPGVDVLLQRFWEIEEVPSCESNLTPEQLSCESHFKENLKILPSGRFEVRLPFKKTHHPLV